MMKKSDMVRAAKEYLDAVHLGLDPVSRDALPADSVGMDRSVREAAGFASAQLGGLLANKSGQNKRPGAVDALYDNLVVLEALGAGRDPSTGAAFAADDPMGSGRARRGMAFAAETLDGIFDKARGRRKASFRLPADIADGLVPGDEPLMVTGIVKMINGNLPDPDRVNGLQAQQLNDWLEKDGVLGPKAEPGQARMPTDKGLAMGITVEDRTNGDGEPYKGVTYPPQAQAHILAHLGEISDMVREQRLEAEKAKEQEARAAKREAAIAKQKAKGKSYGKQAEDAFGDVAETAGEPAKDPSLDPWG